VGQIGSGYGLVPVFKKNASLVGRIGSRPCLVGRLGSGLRTPPCGSDRLRVRVSASLKNNARLFGRIGSWPCLVGQIGSGYGLVPVFKKMPASWSDRVMALSRGSARVRTPPCGSGSDRVRVHVSASFQKKCPPRGWLKVRAVPHSRQGRCTDYPRAPMMYCLWMHVFVLTLFFCL